MNPDQNNLSSIQNLRKQIRQLKNEAKRYLENGQKPEYDDCVQQLMTVQAALTEIQQTRTYSVLNRVIGFLIGESEKNNNKQM